MNDGIEILNAKQYFDELQQVLSSLPMTPSTELQMHW